MLSPEKGDLFLTAGDPTLVDLVQEALDTGNQFSFPEHEEGESGKRAIVLAFGSALLRLFRNLPEPVIPWAIQSRMSQAVDRDTAFEVRPCYRFLHGIHNCCIDLGRDATCQSQCQYLAIFLTIG